MSSVISQGNLSPSNGFGGASMNLPLDNPTKLSNVSAVDTQVVSKVIAKSEMKPSDVNQTSQVTRETIAHAAQQIQSFVQSMGRNLNFYIDQTTGYHVVRVVNPETNEVVRQLPSEELLKIAQNMASLKNALVSQRA